MNYYMCIYTYAHTVVYIYIYYFKNLHNLYFIFLLLSRSQKKKCINSILYFDK